MYRATALVACAAQGRLGTSQGAWLGMVLLSCLMLLPHEVHAQARGKVQTYVLSARRLYEDLEYERALEQISRAKRFSRGDADDVLLSLYEGLILADLGRKDESTASFKAALFLRPDAKLPVKVSPKVEQQFEAVRQQVKRELAKQDAQEPVAKAEPLEPTRPSASVKPPSVVPTPQGPQTTVAPPVEEASSGALRSRAWLPATLGGVLLVGGGVSYALAKGEQSKLRDDDVRLATPQDVERTVSRGRTYQTVGLSLAGAGILGLGVSAGMYLLGGPSTQDEVGLGLSTDGTSAFVYGRWP